MSSQVERPNLITSRAPCKLHHWCNGTRARVTPRYGATQVLQILIAHLALNGAAFRKSSLFSRPFSDGFHGTKSQGCTRGKRLDPSACLQVSTGANPVPSRAVPTRCHHSCPLDLEPSFGRRGSSSLHSVVPPPCCSTDRNGEGP